MERPEFSSEARARILAAHITADDTYNTGRRTSPPLTDPQGTHSFVHINMQWAAIIVGAYSREACKLASSGEWHVERVADVVRRLLDDLLNTVRNRCDEVVRLSAGQLNQAWLESTFAEIRGRIESTQEWRDYQRELLRIANLQSIPQGSNTSVIPSEEDPNFRPQEIERRTRLLAEYKSATGNPSNRAIYTARNSGIHKPEFHRWLRGDLPASSQTLINFERFLRDKKHPIPRKPRHE